MTAALQLSAAGGHGWAKVKSPGPSPLLDHRESRTPASDGKSDERRPSQRVPKQQHRALFTTERVTCHFDLSILFPVFFFLFLFILLLSASTITFVCLLPSRRLTKPGLRVGLCPILLYPEDPETPETTKVTGNLYNQDGVPLNKQ